MSDRLISADKLKKHYAWWQDENKHIYDAIVDAQPTVDAVEVVRCKDCKWNYDTSVNHGNMFPKCKFTDYVRTGDFYCAMGERREDD